jgi:hypothetical protein
MTRWPPRTWSPQLIRAIRRVRREVAGAAEVIAEHCTVHEDTDPGKPAIAWYDP